MNFFLSVQSIQNKINLVVAIVVLKLKPEYLTGEQYAKKIQEMVYDQWVKVNIKS